MQVVDAGGQLERVVGDLACAGYDAGGMAIDAPVPEVAQDAVGRDADVVGVFQWRDEAANWR